MLLLFGVLVAVSAVPASAKKLDGVTLTISVLFIILLSRIQFLFFLKVHLSLFLIRGTTMLLLVLLTFL